MRKVDKFARLLPVKNFSAKRVLGFIGFAGLLVAPSVFPDIPRAVAVGSATHGEQVNNRKIIVRHPLLVYVVQVSP